MTLNARYFEKLPNFLQLRTGGVGQAISSAVDSTLLFDSRFESGNLHKATQISEFEYDLDLKFDHGSTVPLS